MGSRPCGPLQQEDKTGILAVYTAFPTNPALAESAMGTVLKIENIGQIKKADIRFGDLTVFVGPQATGKSIALQFLKLLLDTGNVQSELRQYGIDWDSRIGDFFDVYFGEGMRALWQEHASRITWEGRDVDMQAILRRQRPSQAESLFFIPAQRVLTLRDGWPRPFTDYAAGDPFVVRHFSESLRLLMEQQFAADRNVFPQERQLKKEFRDLLNHAVFGDFALKVDRHLSQKRLMLGRGNGNGALPFMVWSAGQREFMPLLLSFYWLMPPAKVARRKNLRWVVIEEPEMGLHTQAISAVLLITLELLRRGYKVCLSTHSPYVLDVVWALNLLKEHRADKKLVLDIFDVSKGTQVDAVAESALRKDIKVYYFNRETGQVKDISGLDPGATEASEAGWGGLGEFSGRVADVVAKAVGKGD
jgi:hypothetical protein